MKLFKHFVWIVLWWWLAMVVAAQEVVVTVRPTRNPLPAQVLPYLDHPGKYFSVTVSNMSDSPQQLYLGLEIEQLLPKDFQLYTSTQKLPQRPLVVAPQSSVVLTQLQLRNLFKQLDMSDIHLSKGSVEDFTKGIIGLMPEGEYEGTITAYRWDPTATTAEAVSQPSSGKCRFSICYSASAPEIVQPAWSLDRATSGASSEMEEAIALDLEETPVFSWTPVTTNCVGLMPAMYYDLKFYHLYPGQTPEEALAGGNVSYQVKNLRSTQYIMTLPLSQRRIRFSDDALYVMQVEAHPRDLSATDPSNEKYFALQNEGKSSFRVLKIRYGAKEPQEEDGEKEPATPAEEGAENDTVDLVIAQPELVAPEKSGVWTTYHFTMRDSLKIAWEPSVRAAGDEARFDTLKLKYELRISKMPTGAVQIDSAMLRKPIYTKEYEHANDTITLKWAELKDSIAMDERLLVAVVVKVDEKEKHIAYGEHGANVYVCRYHDYEDLYVGDCYRADTVQSKEAKEYSSAELKGKKVRVGRFEMTIKKATKVSGGKAYEGEGYVVWRPWGKDLKIAVSFDSISINEEGQVVAGVVRSARQKETVLPYGMLDSFGVNGWIGVETTEKYGKHEEGLKKACGEYWKYVHGGMKETMNLYHIIDSSIETDLHSEPYVLPLGMPKEMCPNLPFDVSMTEMVFSPRTAYTNLIIMFNVPGYDPEKLSLGDGILVFGAPCLCLEPDKLWSGSGMAALLSDISVQDPDLGFEFAFKSPTDYKEPTDGCYVTWEEGKFNSLSIECEANLPELLLADKEGNIVPGASPKCHFSTTISNWEDWSAEVNLDPFQSPDAAGYTFYATGKGGIWIDHSKKWNPTGFQLPRNYEADFSEEHPKEWMGVWIDDMALMFPEAIKAVVLEEDSEDEEEKAEAEKTREEYGRIQLGLGGVLLDESGISMSAYMDNVLCAKTAKIGGWKFSIDNIQLALVQNRFEKFGFSGEFEVPLLDGTITYETSVQQSEKNAEGQRNLCFDFKSKTVDGLSLDFILGEATFDKDQTYFHVTSSKDSTRIELLTGGSVTIASKNKKETEGDKEENLIEFNLPDIHFVGLRLANYSGEGVYTQSSEVDSELKNFLKQQEISNDDKSFFFNIGKWSLSSEEKDFWDFPLRLDDIRPVTAKGGLVGLYVQGAICVFGGESKTKKNGVAAGLGITFLSKVDWSTWDIDYDHANFDKIVLEGAFGGGMLDVKGEMTLKYEETSGENGFDVGMKINVNELFSGDFTGSYVKVNKTEEDYKIDEKLYGEVNRSDSTYKAGHFYCNVDVSSVGAVSLTNIMGGFYINKRLKELSDPSNQEALEENLRAPVNAYQCSGGAFGMGLSVGSENMVKGKMAMVVMYDAEHDVLSRFHLAGKVDALTLPNQSEGLIKGAVDIIYEHKEPKSGSLNECKQFTMNLTVSSEGDMADMYKKFTGKEYELPDCMASLEEFDQEHAEEENKESHEQEKVTGKVGGKVGLEFQFGYYPNRAKSEQKKWHLNVGNPFGERCKFTIINLSFGKDKPVGAWAKLEANAYLCMGNDLPHNGQLPPLPESVKTALGMKDPDGKKSDKISKIERVRSELISKGPQGKVNGGVMFGAGLEGEFGFNAVFCYANVGATMGFDYLLKQYGAGVRCQDNSRTGGKNGFYGMGQLYARLQGELGLMIDIWLYKGKVPLFDGTFGALLKGGAPNPSWAYGKVRGKGSILNGLIKFNSTIEMRCGKVCVPSFGHPLDDVKIFGDVSPGYEQEEEGWKEDEAVKASSPIHFATNMKMHSQLCLIDENELYSRAGMDKDIEDYRQASQRIFEFRLDPMMKLNGKMYKWESPKRDMENFRLVTPLLEPHTKYKLTLSGYAKEIRNGKAVDPVFNDSTTNYKHQHKPWTQSVDVYFRTGALPENAIENVQAFFPFEDEGVYLEEAASPKLLMQYDRSDYWNDPQYEYSVRMERGELTPSYSLAYRPLNWSEVSQGRAAKYMDMPVHQSVEETMTHGEKHQFITLELDEAVDMKYIEPNTYYRYQLVRTNKKALEEMIEKCRNTYKNMFKQGLTGAISVKDSIAALGTDSAYDFQRELYAYYAEMDSLYGPNEAKRRVREFIVSEKNTADYSTVIYTKTFKTGPVVNLYDYLKNYNHKGGPQVISQEGEFNPYSVRYDKIEYKDRQRGLSLRPTEALAYWNNGAVTWRKFNDYALGVGYSQPGGIEYQLSSYSAVPYPASKIYSSDDLENLILPSKEWMNFYTKGVSLWYVLQDLEKTADLYLHLPRHILAALQRKWTWIMGANGLPSWTDNYHYYSKVFDGNRRAQWRDLDKAYSGVSIDFKGGKFPFYQFAAMFGRLIDGKKMLGVVVADRALLEQCHQVTGVKPAVDHMDEYLKTVKGMNFMVKRNNGFDTQTTSYDVLPTDVDKNIFTISKSLAGSGDKWQSVRPSVEHVVFSDPHLREYVLRTYDANKNGLLERSEAKKIVRLAYDKNDEVKSLVGVEHCPNLEVLAIPCLNVSFVDLRKNEKLKVWTVSRQLKGVKRIELGENKNLKAIELHNAPSKREEGTLLDINLSGLTGLRALLCANQHLRKLDVSHLAELEHLDVSGNSLSALDVSKNRNLRQVYSGRQWVYGEQEGSVPQLCRVRIHASQKELMRKMGIAESSGKDKVMYLSNVQKTSQGCRNMNAYHEQADLAAILDPNLYAYLLEKYGEKGVAKSNHGKQHAKGGQPKNDGRVLRASRLLYVSELDCSGLQIESMKNVDVVMPHLERLNCSSNKLMELDVSGLKHLKWLDCRKNKLCELLVEPKNSLAWLDCSYNNLMGLPFDGLVHLTYLDMSGQQFSVKGIEACTQLKELRCRDFKFVSDNFEYVSMTGLNCETLDLSNSSAASTYIAVPMALRRLRMDRVETDVYFKYCTHLQELSAAHIRNTSYLTKQLKATHSLTHLNLHYTTLKEDYITGEVAVKDNPNADNQLFIDRPNTQHFTIGGEVVSVTTTEKDRVKRERVYVPIWTFSDCLEHVVELDISHTSNHVVNLHRMPQLQYLNCKGIGDKDLYLDAHNSRIKMLCGGNINVHVSSNAIMAAINGGYQLANGQPMMMLAGQSDEAMIHKQAQVFTAGLTNSHGRIYKDKEKTVYPYMGYMKGRLALIDVRKLSAQLLSRIPNVYKRLKVKSYAEQGFFNYYPPTDNSGHLLGTGDSKPIGLDLGEEEDQDEKQVIVLDTSLNGIANQLVSDTASNKKKELVDFGAFVGEKIEGANRAKTLRGDSIRTLRGQEADHVRRQPPHRAAAPKKATGQKGKAISHPSSSHPKKQSPKRTKVSRRKRIKR